MPHRNFKGCTWDAAVQRWRVRVTYKGKQLHCGRYADGVHAAHAYDRAAVYLLGPYHSDFNFGAAAALADLSTPNQALVTMLKDHRQELMVPLPQELALYVDQGAAVPPAPRAGSKRARSSSICSGMSSGDDSDAPRRASSVSDFCSESGCPDGMYRQGSNTSATSELPPMPATSLAPAAGLERAAGASGSFAGCDTLAAGSAGQPWQQGCTPVAAFAAACPGAAPCMTQQQVDEQVAGLACTAALMAFGQQGGWGAAPGGVTMLRPQDMAAAADLQAGMPVACGNGSYYAPLPLPGDNVVAEDDDDDLVAALLAAEPGCEDDLLWLDCASAGSACSGLDAGAAPMKPVLAPPGVQACAAAHDPIVQALQGFRQPPAAQCAAAAALPCLDPCLEASLDAAFEGAQGDLGAAPSLDTQAGGLDARAGSSLDLCAGMSHSGSLQELGSPLADVLQSMLVQRLPTTMTTPAWAPGALPDAMMPGHMGDAGPAKRARLMIQA